jgi:hypothetical protein
VVFIRLARTPGAGVNSNVPIGPGGRRIRTGSAHAIDSDESNQNSGECGGVHGKADLASTLW